MRPDAESPFQNARFRLDRNAADLLQTLAQVPQDLPSVRLCIAHLYLRNFLIQNNTTRPNKQTLQLAVRGVPIVLAAALRLGNNTG